MAVTGKTGADAIFIALSHICRLITKYQLKLTSAVVAAQAAGAITAGQAAAITAFIATANAACAAFQALSFYTGF
jgi:hypothetical protein